jgi:hypothetical protein
MDEGAKGLADLVPSALLAWTNSGGSIDCVDCCEEEGETELMRGSSTSIKAAAAGTDKVDADADILALTSRIRKLEPSPIFFNSLIALAALL